MEVESQYINQNTNGTTGAGISNNSSNAEVNPDRDLLKKRLDELMAVDAEKTKERTYKQLIEKYKKDLKDIQAGTHVGFKNAVQLVELEYEEAIKRADLFYKYQVDCANHVYQTEYEQTLLDYKTERDGLQEEMLEQIEMKKRKLRENHEGFDLNLDASNADSGRSTATRKTTTRLMVREEIGRTGSRKKPKDKGAVLTFSLKEQDAIDDLNFLRKILGPGQRYKVPQKRRF